MNEDGSVHTTELQAALEPPSAELDEPEELFEKIEDARITELNQKLDERIQAVDGDSDESSDDEDEDGDIEPLIDERVSVDEFESFDIRIGEIRSAEPIPESDQLVKLMVDIGNETRQIVAGIKRLHDVDALPETRVVIISNLEQATIMGYESNGMLLAAGEQADLLTTMGDSPPGTRVR